MAVELACVCMACVCVCVCVWLIQCILLAAVTAAVSCVVESCHSSPRSPCLWTCLLGHLPGTVPLPFLPVAKVSSVSSCLTCSSAVQVIVHAH